MLSQHTVNVNDVDYIISPFKGKQGLKIQAKLVKLIGPALGALSGLEDNTEQMAVFGAIIQEVLGRVDEDDVINLIEELLSLVYKGSMKINFDNEFALNYASLFLLVKEVIMYNYQDVFSKLGMAANA